MSPAAIHVRKAMVQRERDSGRPLRLTVVDLRGDEPARDGLVADLTDDSIRRGLRELASLGLARKDQHVGNGLWGWMLTDEARRRYGLIERPCRPRYDAASNNMWCAEHCQDYEDCPR